MKPPILSHVDLDRIAAEARAEADRALTLPRGILILWAVIVALAIIARVFA